MKFLRKLVVKPVFSPHSLFLSTTLIALLYTFMEWTYNINNSALANVPYFGQKLLILLNSSAILAFLCIIVYIPFFLLHHFVKNEKVRSIIRWIFSAIPALLLTTTLLLLVDNTTYSIWSEGIVTSKGFIRGLYLGLYLLAFFFLLTRVVKFTNNIEKSLQSGQKKARKWLTVIVSALIAAFMLIPILTNPDINLSAIKQTNQSGSSKRPNIILITVDSVNAEKLSMYGYTKETTPFLEELSKTSLVGMNHFSNAQGTIGSLTSLLTGKYPADERVLASDDLLSGQDAYQHLPGILKQYGYETVQLAYSYYADAENLNIQDGFDLANGEESQDDPASSILSATLPTNYFYFLRNIYIRATDRLGHIFFIKDMKNPYKQVTETPDKFNDAYKMATALTLLEDSQKPMFIHIHILGPHGPKYYPATQVFSAGMDPNTQGSRVEAFYLDSILEFDTSLKDFYGKLNDMGALDNTLLIVTADHTQRWSIGRLPLLIHFPNDEMVGKITSNTENLDLAPTILDYLNIDQPKWMVGQSLLSIKDPDRLIFIAQISDSTKDPNTGKVSYPDPEAPFYQFGKMSVVSCDTWYKLNLDTQQLTTGKVVDYKGECPQDVLSADDALQAIEAHLLLYGFNTSSLNDIQFPN